MTYLKLAAVLAMMMAIASVWAPSGRGLLSKAPAWVAPLAVAIAFGLASGALAWPALWPIGLWFAIGAWVQSRHHARAASIACGAMALALALHAFPWFHGVTLWPATRVSASAGAFPLTAHLDKALAGLGLLVWAARRCRHRAEWRAVWRTLVWLTPLTVAAVLGLGWAIGLVRVDPKWPLQTPVFLVLNLLFTCVAEEGFFRGWLQGQLAVLAARRRLPSVLPVVLAGLAFGAAHLGAGPRFASLAALAGLGYGWAYARTGRIEAAVLAHFAVNAAHFIFFTYPALS